MSIYRSHIFSIPFSYDRHLGYFHILATVNSAVIKVVVQIYVKEIDFISFRCIHLPHLVLHVLLPSLEGPFMQFSSVAQPCLTLCDPMNHSTPGLLSITNSRSPPKLMSIESVMPSKYLILCRPLLLLPSIFPSIRVFSNESALHIRWPKCWGFCFSVILPMNIQD